MVGIVTVFCHCTLEKHAALCLAVLSKHRKGLNSGKECARCWQCSPERQANPVSLLEAWTACCVLVEVFLWLSSFCCSHFLSPLVISLLVTCFSKVLHPARRESQCWLEYSVIGQWAGVFAAGWMGVQLWQEFLGEGGLLCLDALRFTTSFCWQYSTAEARGKKCYYSLLT